MFMLIALFLLTLILNLILPDALLMLDPPALFCPKSGNTDTQLQHRVEFFHTNVFSVLFHGSSTWAVTAAVTRKLQTFDNIPLWYLIGVLRLTQSGTMNCVGISDRFR